MPSVPYAEREDLRQHLRSTYDRSKSNSSEYTTGGTDQWLYTDVPSTVCEEPQLFVNNSDDPTHTNTNELQQQRATYSVDKKCGFLNKCDKDRKQVVRRDNKTYEVRYGVCVTDPKKATLLSFFVLAIVIAIYRLRHLLF